MRARALCAAALVVAACGAAASKKPRRPTLSYEKAVEQLGSHRTWCEGAKALVEIGDRRALVPMVKAYETPIEGADKQCLLKALRALGPREAVTELFDRGGAEERRAAAKLMELYEDESYVARLEKAAVSDGEAAVRRQALKALVCQLQTPAWEAAMARLLESGDEGARGQAIESLARRNTESARAALKARAAKETVPSLKAKIERALAEPAK